MGCGCGKNRRRAAIKAQSIQTPRYHRQPVINSVRLSECPRCGKNMMRVYKYDAKRRMNAQILKCPNRACGFQK